MKPLMFSLCLMCFAAVPAALAASVTITGVNQRPWMIKDDGNLKSEMELMIENPQGPAIDAWVKIGVTGKPDYMESLGSLTAGKTSKVVHVLELNNDGENVTFALYDNSSGNGTALFSKTLAQKKIRHWRLYVAHNSHQDIGYTDYQEDLKTKKWPGFWDQALLKDMPNSDNWPAESKVRLEAEGVFQLYTSLPVRSADWFETLRERLAQGRFAYGAAFGNIAHSNWGAEELARSAYFSERFFKDRTGVESTKNIIMRDEPSLSWGVIDAMVETGAKSFSIHHNSDHNPWRGTTVYPELFYAQGRNPANKLLVWNSPVENYCVDELHFCETNTSDVISRITTKLMGYQGSTKYPYDVAMVNFTYHTDNGPMSPQVYQNIKAINDKDYVYPKLINANYNQFFDDVAAHGSHAIPTYKGTIEDWWNFGAASTAYETGLNRANHDKLASAEFFATLACTALPNHRYPYEALAGAYENLLLWDEHTWGSPSPAVDHQWRWKRNTAIASDLTSTYLLKDSMAAINSLIPTTDKTFVIYNNLSWSRSDIVSVSLDGLPTHFDLIDVDSGSAIKYQKLSDGTMVFAASNVPGLGYKTIRVTSRSDDPVFTTRVTTTADTLENDFFKVTFTKAGHITSILDKKHGNTEMVDRSAPHPFNQYVIYKEGALAGQVESATITTSGGPILGSMTADGSTTGLDSLSRKVILYDSLARIDIVNDAVKGQQLANVEMGYFAFPLNVPNFMIRHEMPTGDMHPGVNADMNNPASEQYFTSSTAFYTVNRWIDASNQSDWGVTFSSLQAPLVSYGKPDLGTSKGAWNVKYNTEKPWLYSMAFNNEWQTNFQKTQPGRMVFQYSLRGHAGGTWQSGNADTFGAEATSPFKVALITDKQAGHGFNPAKGQFVGIDKSNVLLTTAKLAEANGEGIILRFNEIKGQPTSVNVDLSWFAPDAVIETDLIENNKSLIHLNGYTIRFTIPAFGFKTVRLTRGAAPQPASGLTATFDANGCQVTWAEQAGSVCFELFRGTSNSYTPGTGTYLATVSANHYFDPTVKAGLSRTYYYSVRAVQAVKKHAFTAAVQAVSGTIADTEAPSVPVLTGVALRYNKVTLSWPSSTDNVAIKGYKVYRNGKQIADLAAVFGSWLDTDLLPGRTYTYTVKAWDVSGNLSAASNPVAITTPRGVVKNGNIAPDATASVSSQFDDNYVPENAVYDGFGDWASRGEMNPWIQLTWDSPKTIHKIVLRDRPNLTDNTNTGTLSFSDGSSIAVTGIPADGTPKEVAFDNKTVTWVKFQVTGGVGLNVGLARIEALVP